MHWNKRVSLQAGQVWPPAAGFLLGVVLLIAVFFLSPPQAAQSQTEQKLTVYSAQTSYTVAILNRNGREYVGLLELLEPLGPVSAKLEGKKKKWRIQFGEQQGLFSPGETRARIQKADLDLEAPFLLENSRGLIPLHQLPQIMGLFLPVRSISWREQTHRLILDNAELRFSAAMRPGTTGQLIIHFSAPADPSVATEPGKLRMIFRHEALLPETPGEVRRFNDRFIPALAYSENNGVAELTISGTAPLTAFFSEDRKTVTVVTLQPVQPLPSPPPQSPTQDWSRGASSPNAPHNAAAAPKEPASRNFLVVIDAAHGGEDTGGTLASGLTEKDVVLQLARRLRSELQSRGIASRLVRDGDNALTPDQRAAITNQAVPSLYVGLHATTAGTGVHLFTSNLMATRPSVFLSWDSAQAAYVDSSHAVATAIETELLRHDVLALDRNAEISPLNAIAAPGLALELAKPANGTAADLSSASYQQSVCGAVATAVANLRTQLPHGGISQ